MKLYTSKEVAAIYGVTYIRICAKARKLGLTRQGRDWLFTEAELELLKPRSTGRPGKGRSKLCI